MTTPSKPSAKTQPQKGVAPVSNRCEHGLKTRATQDAATQDECPILAPARVGDGSLATASSQSTGTPPPGAPPSLAAKLRNIRVGLRQDLEVSRHMFRGAPCYIVRDPITFQSQRFEPPEYEILVRIQSDRSLGTIFDELAAAGKLDANDQEGFAEFVFGLHRLGFLRLPVSDDKSLYRRFQLRERANRKSQLLGFMFLRVPLWNPDGFLGRTVGYVRPLFSRAAFGAWLVCVVSAALVAWRNWSELSNPLHDVLVSLNVPLLLGTLLVLKVFHEFGHAYACKHYGGHVPEMGVYLILFTPCAYVDATASWGFSRKRERLIVCLAGMYVEAAIAAVALFVWHLSDGALIRSIAHHVIFLASAVTVLFNINPLMRYDGYYILSDMVEVPNLRQKAKDYVTGLAKRVLLGVRDSRETVGKRLRLILASYGIASSLYRVSMVVAIAAILAFKLSLVGLLIGVVMIGSTVLGAGLKLTSYLWYSKETANCRRRAIALTVLTFVLLPTAIMWLPMPSGVFASGVLSAEQATIVRVHTPGVLEQLPVGPGATVQTGEPLVRLSNDLVVESVTVAEANLASHRLRMDALRERDPAQFRQLSAQLPALQAVLDDAQSRADELQFPSPVGGVVVQRVKHSDVGRFMIPGAPLAMVVSGAWQVRAILTAEQMSSAHPAVGSIVEFRPASDPSSSLRGTVSRIGPAGSRQVTLLPLTHLGGGEVAVDPASGTASEPYFEVTITLQSRSAVNASDTPLLTEQWHTGVSVESVTDGTNLEPSLRYGMTGVVRFDGHAEPIGTTLARRVLRFWNKLLQG